MSLRRFVMKCGQRCAALVTPGSMDIGTGPGAGMCGLPECGADRPTPAPIGPTATTTTMTADGPTMRAIGIMKITATTTTGVTARLRTMFSTGPAATLAGPLFLLVLT